MTVREIAALLQEMSGPTTLTICAEDGVIVIRDAENRVIARLNPLDDPPSEFEHSSSSFIQWEEETT